MQDGSSERPARPLRWQAQAVLIVMFLGVVAGAAATWSFAHRGDRSLSAAETSPDLKRVAGVYRPKESEWESLVLEPVETRVFTSERVTEGKIQVNEDRATPIFSPYAGRVTRLLAKPGDAIQRGQPLFVVEATDMVQAQSDLIAALAAMNKARSALNLAHITEKRSRELFEAKAAPLKEMQNAQAGLVAAQNDMRSAETVLEAARNRLRILGRTDDEIKAFQETGRINADTPVYSPIAGTVVQRKVGPGQFVTAAASEPVFVIGDLSNVWLTAFVRETDVADISVGEELRFTVLAYPNRTFTGRIDYVAASIDPATRRLLVRATIDNADGLLKPEMYANVVIMTEHDVMAAAAPRGALIYEGNVVRAWVARDDRTLELRKLKTGMTNGRMIEVLDGLKAGERIVVKGSLFIDRVATGG